MSYVHLIVEYASVIWFPTLIRDKQLIENVQRRYSKIVTNLTNKAYANGLAVLKLPTLASRRIFNNLVYSFKILSHNHK